VLDLAGYPGAPDGDVEAFLKPETVHASFAQDLPETDRRLIAAEQRPPQASIDAILAAVAATSD
jgi:hypothetical protein